MNISKEILGSKEIINDSKNNIRNKSVIKLIKGIEKKIFTL